MTRFKARQSAQERDLAKNELERIIQSVKNKTNRFYNHEKPLQSLKDNSQQYNRAERDYGGSSHSRRNLDTYQKLYFNNINNMSQFAHNDGDPFNINVAAPAQPQMHYNPNNYARSNQQNNYGTILQTNSQNIGLDFPEKNHHAFAKPKPDPLSYGTKQFEYESYNAMQQLGTLLALTILDNMVSPADSYPYHDQQPQNFAGMEPMNMHSESRQVRMELHPGNEDHDIHSDNLQQLDNVLESINDV